MNGVLNKLMQSISKLADKILNIKVDSHKKELNINSKKAFRSYFYVSLI